ncbi:MAG: hypothetical protein CME06_13335 [Gemmatimonadetes bacterium]|nr:hypothetical protein [Gemmatimonadota bacterium]
MTWRAVAGRALLGVAAAFFGGCGGEAESPCASGEPIDIGYFHGGRAQLLHRAQIVGEFARGCVDPRLIAGRDADGELFAIPGGSEPLDAVFASESVARWGSGEIVEAIAGGAIDGGAVGEAEFVDAASRGLPITAVATLGINRNEAPGYALLLRRGVESDRSADLSAFRVGVNRSSPFDLVLAREFVRQLAPKGFAPNIVERGSVREITRAIESGDLDGGFYHYRAAKELIDAGVATLNRRLDWVDADLSHALLVFRNDFLERRPEDVERLLSAYLRQVAFEADLPEDPDELALGFPDWELYPLVEIGRLERVRELMLDHGLLNREAEADLYPFVDNRFITRVYVPRHLLVVQWEGADAHTVQTMLTDWELPNLRRLVERGAYCDLSSAEITAEGAPWRARLEREGVPLLDLRAGAGGSDNRGVTEQLVDHLSESGRRSRAVLLHYEANDRAGIAACDAELRTLSKTLGVLGLEDETLIYVLGGRAGAGGAKTPGAFLATNDLGVPAGAADADGVEGALLHRLGISTAQAGDRALIRPPRGSGAGATGTEPNIIMIALDAIRADHLGCLGYGRNTTPNLDALAEDGLLFAQAISPAGYTVPSTVSLLTGMHAPAHGVPFAIQKLPSTATTLAQLLRDHGYSTTAITGSVHNSSMIGYGKGFERYLSEMEYGRLREVLARARQELNDRSERPFFLYLHAYDAHAPYEVPEEFAPKFGAGYEGVLANLTLGHPVGGEMDGSKLLSESGAIRELSPEDRQHWIDRYDTALAHADHRIGEFLRYMKTTGLEENTVLIVLGNHGEGLFDHGSVLKRRHGDLWEEGIHVPLIVRLPEQHMPAGAGGDAATRTIDTQAQLIDLMPTLLELLDIPIPESCQGRSLFPLLDGSAPADYNQYAYSIGSAGGNKFSWRSCVRSREWKLLRFHASQDTAARVHLYRLEDDPGEQNDLSAEEPEVVAALSTKLDAYDEMLPRGHMDAMNERRQRWLRTQRGLSGVRPNVLLIIVDTLRADRLSCYGYDRFTTPNLDALAASGVLFESAYTQSNWTLPSFASLLTGSYPTALGMLREGAQISDFPYVDPALGQEETTLAEALRADGYRTAAFFTGRFNDSPYGIDQGFELYRNYKRNIDKNQLPMRSFPDFLPEAYEWMESNDRRPFFVALNPSEPHRPYLPPEIYMKPFTRGYEGPFDGLWISKPVLIGIDREDSGWSLSLGELPGGARWPRGVERPFGGKEYLELDQADIDYLGNRYDACVSYADRFIGEIVDRIQKRSLYETIIIVTSDHGEGLGDHGVFLHATSPPRLYEEITHVPLIIKPAKTWMLPRRRVVDTPVELVDLMPTVLDLVGAPPVSSVQGRSLVGAMKGDAPFDPERPVFSETRGYGSTVRSVRQGDWKLILSEADGSAERAIELFDLASDPNETRNVAAIKPSVVEALIRLLRGWAGENAWLQALAGAP